jgi:hypothetical protein
MYIKANVEYQPKTRKDFLVDEINPGKVFTISALSELYIYTKTVRAEKNIHVVKFDSTVLNGLIAKDPKLNYILMRNVANAAKERLGYTRVQLAAAWAK